MVSPFGPVLANLHTNFYVERWLDQFQFWYYFAASMSMILFVCLILNQMQMSFLNFVILNILILYLHLKNRKRSKLAFLDVLFISNTDQNVCTCVYGKTTSVGLYTNFVGFTQHSFVKLNQLEL